MKKFNPIKKLAIGLLLLTAFFTLFHVLDGADGLVAIKKSVQGFFREYMPEDLADLLGILVCLPLPIFMVYAAVSGAYRTFTFYHYNPVFEDHTPGGVLVKGHEAYPNINRVLSYRESKLAGMSNERAAELYINSSKIETLYTGYNNGPETQRTLSYIESKLSGMSSDRGLNYLSNKL